MLAATIDFIDPQFDNQIHPRFDSGDRRAGAERMAIDRTSTLRTPERAPLDIAVLDLSARGFRFETRRPLPIGALVRIGLCGAGVQDARIVRHADGAYGCAFLEPLSAERMATAFTAAAIVQGPFAVTGAAAAHAADTGADMAPDIERWPRGVRVALLLGTTVVLWGGLIAGARLVLG